MIEQIAQITMDQVPSRPPVKVAPETRLGEVVALMRNGRTGAALVVENDELVGIFTERDLLRRVDHAGFEWREVPVSSVMTARPMIIREDDSLGEAMRRIDVGKRRHLPVLRGRTPVAVVSVRDILGFIARKFPADFINLPPSPDREAREPWGG